MMLRWLPTAPNPPLLRLISTAKQSDSSPSWAKAEFQGVLREPGSVPVCGVVGSQLSEPFWPFQDSSLGFLQRLQNLHPQPPAHEGSGCEVGAVHQMLY